MSWQKESEELEARRSWSRQMGGSENVERHHGQGKLTIRERIDALVDGGSFTEVGSLSGTGEYDDGGNRRRRAARPLHYGRGPRQRKTRGHRRRGFYRPGRQQSRHAPPKGGVRAGLSKTSRPSISFRSSTSPTGPAARSAAP